MVPGIRTWPPLPNVWLEMWPTSVPRMPSKFSVEMASTQSIPWRNSWEMPRSTKSTKERLKFKGWLFLENGSTRLRRLYCDLHFDERLQIPHATSFRIHILHIDNAFVLLLGLLFCQWQSIDAMTDCWLVQPWPWETCTPWRNARCKWAVNEDTWFKSRSHWNRPKLTEFTRSTSTFSPQEVVWIVNGTSDPREGRRPSQPRTQGCRSHVMPLVVWGESNQITKAMAATPLFRLKNMLRLIFFLRFLKLSCLGDCLALASVCTMELSVSLVPPLLLMLLSNSLSLWKVLARLPLRPERHGNTNLVPLVQSSDTARTPCLLLGTNLVHRLLTHFSATQQLNWPENLFDFCSYRSIMVRNMCERFDSKDETR